VYDQFKRYTEKILRDRTAPREGVWFYALDDRLSRSGPAEAPFGDTAVEEILRDLNAAALLVVRATEPWPHLMAEGLAPGENRIVPRDSETKTFFHDIPVIRDVSLRREEVLPALLQALRERKGVVTESGLIVTRGSLTVEQAYITLSSIIHACFVAYHLGGLVNGVRPGDPDRVRGGWENRRAMAPVRPEDLAPGPLEGADTVRREMVLAGRMLVHGGLVDSFFGNLSYFDGETIWISRTAASLDELDDGIDPVAVDGTSTAGVTASSELPAHRGIYENTSVRAVLHGHPRFSVTASMLCDPSHCTVSDCGKSCREVRRLQVPGVGAVPIVSGEIGRGGLAERIVPVIGETGTALVYGHGLFATGTNGFREAMDRMARTEDYLGRWIRERLVAGC